MANFIFNLYYNNKICFPTLSIVPRETKGREKDKKKTYIQNVNLRQRWAGLKDREKSQSGRQAQTGDGKRAGGRERERLERKR